MPSTKIRIPRHRAPTHPGQMLQEEFLIPLELSQHELARAIHVSDWRINDLVIRKSRITPNIALRLSDYFGVSAAFWMNLQERWDVYYQSRTHS